MNRTDQAQKNASGATRLRSFARKRRPEKIEATEIWVCYPSGKAFRGEATDNLRYASTGRYEAAPLLKLARDEKLSEHFGVDEFFPLGVRCDYIRIAPALVERLEAIRERLGGPEIRVHSGYRPSFHNDAIGGVVKSAHVDGLAADISASGVDLSLLYKVADEMIGQSGGVGFYPSLGYIHIDVTGYYSRWAVES